MRVHIIIHVNISVCKGNVDDNTNVEKISWRPMTEETTCTYILQGFDGEPTTDKKNEKKKINK